MRLAAAVVFLVSACGGEDACPPGQTRVAGHCVEPEDPADGGDGGSAADAGDASDAGEDGGAPDGGDPADAGEDAGRPCGDAGVLEVWIDGDGDGWGAEGPPDLACTVQPGRAARPGDCDDADPLVSPGAVELCNGLDENCTDGPDDTFGCVQGGGAVECETPCGSPGIADCSDDCVPQVCVIPAETCNHIDDDCNGLVDEGLQAWQGDPVRLTEDTFDQHLPVVGWTGAELAVGWSAQEIGGAGARILELGTFTSDGAALLAPLDMAGPPSLPVAADLGLLGSLALFGYALDRGDGESDTTLLVRVLVEEGGPIPLPIGRGGPLDPSSPFEVMPRDNGLLISKLAPAAPPNELRVASWSLDPIHESHLLTVFDVSHADIEPEPGEALLVASTAMGEVSVGRYDRNLDVVDEPRVVTDTGGQVGAAHIVTVRDGALLVFDTQDGLLHALPIEPDLTPRDPVDLGAGILFPDAVASSGGGTDVFVLSIDPGAEVIHAVRLVASGEIQGGPFDLGSTSDRTQLRAAWAGGRWALVWLELFDDVTGHDVMLQSYGCAQ